VQSHAETHVQQPSGCHRNPGTEITMVDVNVLDPVFLQPHRITGSQPCVEQTLHPSQRAFATVEGDPPEQRRNAFPPSQAEKQRSQQNRGPQGLQHNVGYTLISARVFLRRRPHAAGDDTNSTPAQFLNLLGHIGLNRRRKLIGEIGDRQHDKEASARRR
jgi:hypothetical protein